MSSNEGGIIDKYFPNVMVRLQPSLRHKCRSVNSDACDTLKIYVEALSWSCLTANGGPLSSIVVELLDCIAPSAERASTIAIKVQLKALGILRYLIVENHQRLAGGFAQIPFVVPMIAEALRSPTLRAHREQEVQFGIG